MQEESMDRLPIISCLFFFKEKDVHYLYFLFFIIFYSDKKFTKDRPILKPQPNHCWNNQLLAMAEEQEYIDQCLTFLFSQGLTQAGIEEDDFSRARNKYLVCQEHNKTSIIILYVLSRLPFFFTSSFSSVFPSLHHCLPLLPILIPFTSLRPSFLSNSPFLPSFLTCSFRLSLGPYFLASSFP